MRLSAASLVVVLLVGGCAASDPGSPSGVLLPDAGPGYHRAAVSGPLSQHALAAATAVPEAALSAYLHGTDLRGAAERVWTAADGGFVTDIAATFGSASDAVGLVALAARVLPGPATRAFTPPHAPAARGFVQTSAVRGTTMFCVIAFAPAAARVFVMTRCTPYPQDTTVVSALLARQLSRAR